MGKKKTYLITIFGIIVLVIVSLFVIYKINTRTKKIRLGAYSTWDWAPDGRIIFTIFGREVIHTGPLADMGFKHGSLVRKICIMNMDGSGCRIIKEVPYITRVQKEKLRRKALEAEGLHWKAIQDQLREEYRNGTLDKLYPDPALSRIEWIDWNRVNNKLVFVANDGEMREIIISEPNPSGGEPIKSLYFENRTGIAISDPEFKEIKWISYEGSNPRWSPDGKWIAYTKKSLVHKGKLSWYSFDGDIWLMDENGKNQKQITKGYRFNNIKWFPDGERFIVFNDTDKEDYRGVSIVYLSTGKVERIGDGLNGDPSISPDGERVAYYGPGLMIYNIKTGEKVRIEGASGQSPKWSPDGQWVMSGWEGQIELDNPFTEEGKAIVPHG